MNISSLRHSIKHLKQIQIHHPGKEFEFSKNVKNILTKTNFTLLGEELELINGKLIGKCDLWLANCPNNFLVSLELKVGNIKNHGKLDLLELQVEKYTKLLKLQFPKHDVVGFGAYKHTRGILFIENEVNQEINHLKKMIRQYC